MISETTKQVITEDFNRSVSIPVTGTIINVSSTLLII